MCDHPSLHLPHWTAHDRVLSCASARIGCTACALAWKPLDPRPKCPSRRWSSTCARCVRCERARHEPVCDDALRFVCASIRALGLKVTKSGRVKIARKLKVRKLLSGLPLPKQTPLKKKGSRRSSGKSGRGPRRNKSSVLSAHSQGSGGHAGPIHVLNNINVKAAMDLGAADTPAPTQAPVAK